MDLVAGVRVLVNPHESLGNRIRLSAGTVLASAAGYSSAEFCIDAKIPREPLRPPSPLELEMLTVKPDIPASLADRVAILPFPAALFQSEAIRRIRASTTVEEASSIASRQDAARAINALERHIETLRIEPEVTPRCRLVIRAPGLASVVLHPEEQRLVGLHMDGREGLPVDQERKTEKLLALNLGRDARYFLFINLTAAQIRDIMLPKISESSRTLTAVELCHEFMYRFPNYPVVWLSIRPGEAYLAPARTIIHDGSTIGMRSIDINFIHWGQFGSEAPSRITEMSTG